MVTVPKVSVIIPAYNVQQYIEAALTSLERQSLHNFEALIVDDGSTDGTAEVALSFCQRDPRFRLLSKANGGLSSARNYGIQQAQAAYIALLDADDAYEPEKLASHITRLDTEPQVGVVYSASRIIREDGRPTWLRLSGKPIHQQPLLALLCKNFIGHGSNAVFRRSIVDEVGAFDETLASSEDLDFWLRIAAQGHWNFYRQPQPLCCYRVRPSGLTFNIAQMQSCSEQVLAAAYQRSPEQVGPMLPTARAYLARYLARLALTAGKLAEATRLVDCALAEDASIFWRDPRSLVTLAAVRLAPLAHLFIQRSLGSVTPS
ncbi:glycosyltransferase family 2 protein [Leptolyngbya sp. FACHB-261]|uniref:glycosyltransferase family 2 protein n=1 Tax=Leptolyngbya sp. FACHB-261 TaxID=2692806 RepID=UPI00168557C8|nr:glycosyltransferase family 2 protein [Leptolyngbya sp. FACHB-261]MBD2105040.1 glycosyltransferase family 2 protein [Leptolyngbya sp. FACHB-261]